MQGGMTLGNPTATLTSTTAISYSVTAPAVASNSLANIANPDPDDLDQWLDKLAGLESNGRDDIKILDVNNRYSYGCLQFQMRTFLEMGNRYNLLSDKAQADPENAIYSCSLQKRIARAMIQDNARNWRYWYTSVKTRKLGPPPANQSLADAR